MPIRFVDIASRRAQLVAALSGASASLTGTNVAPAGRTGVLQPQLSGAAANLQGLFTTAPNRTGQISAALQGVGGSVAGTVTAPGGLTAQQDWLNRSNPANGVVQAIRFGGSAANVTTYKHPDSMQGNVTWDPAGGIIGDGALKILVNNSDQANSGNWRAPLNAAWASLSNQNFGIGNQDIYIQYRFFYGAGRLTPAPGGGGNKIGITGGYTPSSPGSSSSDIDCEFVQSSPNYIYPWGYHHDGRNGLPQNVDTTTDWNPPAPSPFDQFGHFLQNAIDNGSSLDTAHRYAIYESSSTPVSPGVYKYQEGVPYTLMVHLHIHSYNSGVFDPLNHYEEWIAKDGDTQWTKLHDIQGFAQQAGANDGSLQAAPLGPQGQWFTPYDTGRTSGVANTSQSYDQLIASTNPIALPAVPMSASSSWAPPHEPTWMSVLASKQWFLAPTSIASVADPLSSGVNAATSGLPGMMNYSGMSADRQQAVIKCLADGGHQDYHGNEVYALYLINGVLAWVRERDATNSSTWSGSGLLYPDGRPLSGHTYDMDSGGNGTHVSFGRSAEYTQGGTDGHLIMEFRANNPGVHDNVNNDWVNHSASANVTGTTNTGNQCCTYDPVTNTFIGFVGGTGAVYVLNASTFARVSANTGINMIDGSPQICVALDSVNRMLLVHGTDINGNNIYHWISVANLASGTVTSGTVSGTDVADTCGIDYDPVNRCFLTYSGGNLKYLRPVFNGTTYTSLGSWNNVSGITGVVPPANGAAPGLMGKLKVIWPNALGNVRSVVAYMPGWGTNGNQMYLMPLAAGAIP